MVNGVILYENGVHNTIDMERLYRTPTPFSSIRYVTLLVIVSFLKCPPLGKSQPAGIFLLFPFLFCQLSPGPKELYLFCFLLNHQIAMHTQRFSRQRFHCLRHRNRKTDKIDIGNVIIKLRTSFPGGLPSCALAKSCERSELTIYQVIIMRKFQTEDNMPVYRR